MRSKPYPIILPFVMGLCLLPSTQLVAGGAMLVERHVPLHRFFNRPNIIAFGISGVSMGADIAMTKRALEVPGTREMNPLAHASPALLGLKFAGMGAGVGISYLLHRSGHPRAARIIPLLIGLPSAAAAVHDGGIHR